MTKDDVYVGVAILALLSAVVIVLALMGRVFA